MNTFSESDVIKGMECCSQPDKCPECPYGAACLDERYVNRLAIDALELTRQKDVEKDKIKREAELFKALYRAEKGEKRLLQHQFIKVKSELIQKMAVMLKCGVNEETGVIRCKDVDEVVERMMRDGDISDNE